MTVLLLSGNGFLGTNLAESLLELGCQRVVSLDARPVQSMVLKSNEKFVHVDEAGRFSLDRAIISHKPDAMVILTSGLLPSSTKDAFEQSLRENTPEVLHAVDVAAENGIFVCYFSSAGGIYGAVDSGIASEAEPPTPINYYGFVKQLEEDYITMKARTSGLQYLIVRPSNPYGKYQRLRGTQGLVAVLFGKVLDGAAFELFGDGLSERDYIDVGDVAEVVAELVLQRTCGVKLNISSGQNASVLEMIDRVERISKTRIEVNRRPTRATDPRHIHVSHQKLLSYTSHTFKSLDQGLEDYWQLLKPKRER